MNATRWLPLPVALILSGVPAPANEGLGMAKPWFLHIGANQVDPEAKFAALIQAGVPVYRRGMEYAGIFGGGTWWRRGAYSPTEVEPGSLLEKSAYWAGVYGGGSFVSFGAGGEYVRKGTYVTPQQTNAWFNEVTTTSFGATAFLALHDRNGFGVFLRGGTDTGLGAGLSLNF